MNLHRGVFLDLATIDQGDLDLSPLLSMDIDWTLHPSTPTTDTADHINKADLVISNKVILDRQLLINAESLKLICIAATGTNNIDIQAAKELRIPVTHVKGYATPSVVQHVFALVLALSIKLREYQYLIEAEQWQSSDQFCLLDYPIQELSNKTLGIVGFGELGRGVARAAEAFGMQVLISQRPGGPKSPDRIPFNELLVHSDIVSLHCSLADNTRNLIGKRKLSLMKSNALLINTARGGIIDETALALALRRGEIGGAGIDVLSIEPPKEGNPLLASDIPNLIVTPHIAWASRESRQRLIEEVAKNIQAFVAGESRNRVV